MKRFVFVVLKGIVGAAFIYILVIMLLSMPDVAIRNDGSTEISNISVAVTACSGLFGNEILGRNIEKLPPAEGARLNIIWPGRCWAKTEIEFKVGDQRRHFASTDR